MVFKSDCWWRELHIKHNEFVLILSFAVGIFAALAAFILKSTIHLIHSLLTQSFSKTMLTTGICFPCHRYPKCSIVRQIYCKR